MSKYTTNVEQAVCKIMFEATKSAMQLNNFPLSTCDVQCSFTTYVQDNKVNEFLAGNIAMALQDLGHGL